MTESSRDYFGGTKAPNLSRRDRVLLPLISLATIALLIAFMGLLAQRVLPTHGLLLSNCVVLHDLSSDWQAIPNSVCWEKQPESSLIRYQFNNCGHRAGMPCGAKPPGTYRIVMIGSSFAFGYMVEREESFAALLPAELSRRTGRKVEIYNESMAKGFPHSVAARFHEVLAADPDMILWALTPADVSDDGPRAVDIVRHNAIASGNSPPSPDAFVRYIKHDLRHQVSGLYTHITTMLRYFLYKTEGQDQYVKSFLMNGDLTVGFLKADLSPAWQAHLKQFDTYAARIEGQAKAAGIPLVVVLLPTHVQTDMISVGQWPDGYNPYKLDDEIRSTIQSHGGSYIQILTAFQSLPHPERYYFPIDGHLNIPGHSLVSGFLANALDSGPVPALKSVNAPPVTLAQRR